jgi:hypothetical protein
MNDFGTPLGGKVVPAARDAFENEYFNTPLPAGSVSTILTEAFKALLHAGVVVLDDGTPASDLTIHVHGGRVQLSRTDPATGNIKHYLYASHGVPDFDPAITALADLLAAILNAPPWTGVEDFPYTRN